MKANKVMIFGGGIDMSGSHPELGVPSAQRVDSLLDRFHDNPDNFRSNEAYIVCTGGYGLLAAGVSAPTERKWREGPMMADRLMQNGVPSRLIRVEDESISTVTNLTSSLRQGLVDINNLSPDSPLGLVSHPHHLRRIVDITSKLGIDDTELLPTDIEDDRKKEFILRSLYRISLYGAKSPETLEKRESLIASALTAIRGAK